MVNFSFTKFYVDISILALHLISILLLFFWGEEGVHFSSNNVNVDISI